MHDAAVRTLHPAVIPVLSVQSVQSVQFARKTLWKQGLGTTANRTGALSSPVQSVHFAPSGRSRGTTARQSRSDRSSRSTSPGKRYGNKDLAPPAIGPGRCPLRSDRSDSRHSEVRSMKETQRRPAISVTPVADALSPPVTLVTFVGHRAQRTRCRVPPEGRGASPWRRERLRHWTPCPRNVRSRAASASPRPPSRRDRRSFRWRSKDRRSRLRSSRAAAFRGG